MTAETPVVPAPLTIEPRPGASFAAVEGIRVVTGREPEAVSAAVRVAGRIGRRCGFPVAVVQDDDGSPGAIVLRITSRREDLPVPADLDPALAAEAYRLEVSAERAVVTALGGAGLLRGTYTLQQLARPGTGDAAFDFPPVLVVDHPRFAWRGLSLDVARHFFGVDDVKSVLNVMAAFKLNVLHLHLTDDQGWRLRIPSRPALTDVSGLTAVDGDPGGFYTEQDYGEILTYAASRYITVVPEIDLPGHVNAALHACGELTPTGEPTPVYTGVDVGFSRLDATLPATAPFIRDVLGDVARMTPGGFVHIGGDEVLTMEPAEYETLMTFAAQEVRLAGKAVVGWQEIADILVPGDGRPAPRWVRDVVVQYWDERSGGAAVVAAAVAGARVLLSPATRTYLDLRYDASTPIGTEWAGTLSLRASYEWEPLDVLPGVPAGQVVGVEAALWTETVRTPADLFVLLLPRLAAVAEVAWSAPHRRDWDSFARRLPTHAERWDEAGLTWYRSPDVEW